MALAVNSGFHATKLPAVRISSPSHCAGRIQISIGSPPSHTSLQDRNNPTPGLSNVLIFGFCLHCWLGYVFSYYKAKTPEKALITLEGSGNWYLVPKHAFFCKLLVSDLFNSSGQAPSRKTQISKREDSHVLRLAVTRHVDPPEPRASTLPYLTRNILYKHPRSSEDPHLYLRLLLFLQQRKDVVSWGKAFDPAHGMSGEAAGRFIGREVWGGD